MKKFKQILIKSIKFEFSWLNYKKNFYLGRFDVENIRIENVTHRLEG